jgi:two-component system, LytTR family, response regulator
MKALIVDDEKHCRQVIKSYVEVESPVKEIQEANSVTSALRLIETYQPDLVFLDIQLGNKTSFEILESLSDINFQIIFTTAYDEYALEAFKYSAVHYLLKPIDRKELFEAIERVENKELQYSAQQIEKVKGLFLRQENKAFNVPYDEIVSLIADGSYSKIHKKAGDSIFTSKNLGEYEKILPEEFFRIHKSTIVNLKEVDSLDLKNNSVIMKNGKNYDFSRRKKSALKEALKNYFA